MRTKLGASTLAPLRRAYRRFRRAFSLELSLSHVRDPLLSDTQQRTLAAITKRLGVRLEEMGEVESGLYNYYARKLHHDALLNECDLQALAVLRQRAGQFRRVWEVGSGVGQLTAMLALDGHQVVGVDPDRRRYAAMADVLGVLERHDPLARARITTRSDPFPAALGDKEDVSDDAILVLGCTFTADEAGYYTFENALPHFVFGLIDFPRLFTATTSRDEWRERAQGFSKRYGIATAAVAEYLIPEERRNGELYLISASEA